MSRGLNTESDPRHLPQSNYPEFTQLTGRGGVIRPRLGDVDYTPQPGSIAEWQLEKLGDNDVARAYSADTEAEYMVYAPSAGGTPEVYDHSNTTATELLVEEPDTAPVLLYWHSGWLNSTSGLAAGESGTYTLAYTDNIAGYVTGLGSPVKFTNTFKQINTSVPDSVDVPYGTKITNSTKSGDEAYVRGYGFWATGLHAFLIDTTEQTGSSTWESGDTIVLEGIGTYTLAGLDNYYDVYAYPYFSIPATKPAGCATLLYRLDNTAGFYHRVGEESAALVKDTDSSPDFPYKTDGSFLERWPGPLDLNYLPEQLVGSLDNAKVVGVHKGCLFLAEGSTLRYSEPEQFRYFRKSFNLDVGDTILKVVSRRETAEIYTPTTVKYLVGNPPYFELREIGITEGPVSVGSITTTDTGTFALFDDGIYLLDGSARKNMTAAINSPYIEKLDNPHTTIGGASQGIYYLVDENGGCLAYDWEQGEWFFRQFTAQPQAFLYIDNARSLVAKLPDRFKAIGTQPTETAWALTTGETGDGRLRPTPPKVFVDMDGEIILEFLIDGSSVCSYPIQGPQEVNLPVDRGYYYQVRLTGSSGPEDTEIRNVEFRG